MADQAPDPRRPDLEESTNVTATHARVMQDAAAAAREKRLRENGLEPIPLGVIVACSLVLLIGGVVLGNADKLFAYDQIFRANYVREESPAAGSDALPPIPALDAYARKGQRLYAAKCNGCHGADGRGDGSNYPPLAGSEWVMDHTEQGALIILNGIMGPITVSGKSFNGAMPPQGGGMSAEDLAALMTYIRNSFGNESGDIFTPEMAEKAMEISGSRATPGQPLNADELAAHANDIEGTPMDPTTLVDPATLEPVGN